jgi:hypothetical protein
MRGASLRFTVVEIERTPEPVCPDPFITGLERETESAVGRRGRRPACTDGLTGPQRTLSPEPGRAQADRARAVARRS